MEDNLDDTVSVLYVTHKDNPRHLGTMGGRLSKCCTAWATLLYVITNQLNFTPSPRDIPELKRPP